MSLKHLPHSKWRNIHVFSLPRLDRCQTLGICRMGSFYTKGRVKSIEFSSLLKVMLLDTPFLRYDLPRATKPTYDLSFKQKQRLSKNILDARILLGIFWVLLIFTLRLILFWSMQGMQLNWMIKSYLWIIIKIFIL